MQTIPLSLRRFIFLTILSFIFVFFLGGANLFSKRTKIVFCDVGQGDGIYMRIQNSIDVIIDAGPNNKIVHCLGKHMPFYDRTIELSILSHPQKDHFGGFEEVIKRYSVNAFIMSPVPSKTKSFRQLYENIKKKNIPIQIAHQGDVIRFSRSHIAILWPSKKYMKLQSLSPKSNFDLNTGSLIFTYSEEGHKILFTGDATSSVLESLSAQSISKTTLLKIPHHGSKSGLNRKILNLADPAIAVISVGKNNSYGHPTKEVLNLLEAKRIKILRTDKFGDISFELFSRRLKIIKEFN